MTKNQLLVMTVLLRHPMHTHAVRQEIVELSGHEAWPSKSTVQHALDSLMKSGFVEECQSNPHYWLKARRGVPYELTDAGYRRVRRELSMYFEVFMKSRPWLEAFAERYDGGVH